MSTIGRTRSRSLGLSTKDRSDLYETVVLGNGTSYDTAHSYGSWITLGSGTESMSDEVTISGKYRNNVCSHTRDKTVVIPYDLPTIRRTNGSTTYFRHEHMVGPSGTGLLDTYSLSPAQAGELDASFNKSLMAAMEGSAGRLNLPVAIAEIGSTLSMVTKPWKAVQSLRRAVFSGRSNAAGQALWNDLRGMSCKRASKRLAHAAANGWLMWRYGVEQLVRDIESFSQMSATLDERQRNRESRANRVSRVCCAVQHDGTITHVSVPETGSYNVKRVIEATYVYTRQAKVVVSYPPEHISVLRDVLSLTGTTKILANAWEVIPFSFVVDWFIPVGGVLSNYDAYLAQNQLGPYVQVSPYTASSIRRVVFEWHNYVARNYAPLRFGPILAKKQTQSDFSRGETWTLSATPLLSASASPWTLKRSLDAGALIVQRGTR